MSTEVATTKDFQERMFEKIRSQIGDLMTEEDLKKIVDAAVKKAFFEPSTIIENQGRYDQRSVSGPIPLVKLIDELIRDNVKALIKEWMEAHSEELVKMVKERLDAGIVNAISGAFNSLMADKFYAFQTNMENMFRNMPR